MRRLGISRAVVSLTLSSVLMGLGAVVGVVPAAAAPCTTTLNTSTVSGFTVPAGQTWCFNPNLSTTITSTGNVIVQGVLQMRPSSPSLVHTLRFTGFTESQFQGGGNDPMPTDVGLWVVGAGSLDAAGSTKTSWTRLSGSAAAGARTLSLQAAAIGWAPGDEVVITPTARHTSPSVPTQFDVRTISSISGSSVTLSTGLTYAHPQVNVWTAEIANLTRNVRIEGQDATHRSHVFIRSSVPQTIRNVALRYMGPRTSTSFVLGRYALHFHRMENASRGSLVEGVVGRDMGSHTFVPHDSNGITFRDTVAYNVQEVAYWYDPEVFQSTGPPVEAPFDTLYDHVMAARVTTPTKNHRFTAFHLGAGGGNTVRNSVAVGVQGGITSSGFLWPEQPPSVWTFEDNTAHNNVRNGIFVWQNTSMQHVVTRFVGYHNGYAGIEHGAYTNRYRYQDSTLYGNAGGNIALHAESNPAAPLMTFSRVTLDGAGYTPYGYLLRVPASQTAVAGSPARVCANVVRGHTGSNYHISYTGADSRVSDRLTITSSSC